MFWIYYLEYWFHSTPSLKVLVISESKNESQSVVSNSVTPLEFSRPEYWNEYPVPSPVDLPDPGVEPAFPALQVDSLPTEL